MDVVELIESFFGGGDRALSRIWLLNDELGNGRGDSLRDGGAERAWASLNLAVTIQVTR